MLLLRRRHTKARREPAHLLLLERLLLLLILLRRDGSCRRAEDAVQRVHVGVAGGSGGGAAHVVVDVVVEAAGRLGWRGVEEGHDVIHLGRVLRLLQRLAALGEKVRGAVAGRAVGGGGRSRCRAQQAEEVVLDRLSLRGRRGRSSNLNRRRSNRRRCGGRGNHRPRSSSSTTARREDGADVHLRMHLGGGVMPVAVLVVVSRVRAVVGKGVCARGVRVVCGRSRGRAAMRGRRRGLLVFPGIGCRGHGSRNSSGRRCHACGTHVGLEGRILRPSLEAAALVFGTDKRLHLLVVVRGALEIARQMVLPDLCRLVIAQGLHGLNPLWPPGVEVDGADFGDVHAEVAVNAGAADAHEDTEVPAGPAGALDAALGAELVLRLVQHVGQDHLVEVVQLLLLLAQPAGRHG
eukprot:m.104729 g.104729  ORF g.104729 m.104729 type:complete len:406 (+) comp15768_c1_seq1:1236-2453(+)